MARTLTIFLTTTPYSSQHSPFAMKLAEAALERGLKVNLFASGDGVHSFSQRQRANGLPNAEAGFSQLLGKGLKVYLCGTCLAFRGVRKDHLIEGANPSSLSELFQLVKESDAFISLGT